MQKTFKLLHNLIRILTAIARVGHRKVCYSICRRTLKSKLNLFLQPCQVIEYCKYKKIN
jgi:hypothetical protein